MDTQHIDTERSSKIAALNDAFRRRGEWVITKGVYGLDDTIELFTSIYSYDEFSEDNDPHGEHDFGNLVWDGHKIFWKIDYYGPEMRGWCDPLDDDCRRVLTVMLAEEY